MGRPALQCISPIQLITTFILPHSKPFRGSPFFGDIRTSQGLSQDFSPMLRHQHGVLPLRTPITILRKDCPTIFQGIRNFGTSFLRVLKGSVWKNKWKWWGERGRHFCPSCNVYVTHAKSLSITFYNLLLISYNIEQNCPDLFPASMKMGSMVKVIPGRSSSARLLGTCMTFGSMCISLPMKWPQNWLTTSDNHSESGAARGTLAKRTST